MEVSKILTVVTSLILIVCLTLSVICLVSLRKTLEENNILQQNARRVLYLLESGVDQVANLQKEQKADGMGSDIATDTQPDTEVSARVEAFCIRTTGEKLGIYDTNGNLLMTLEILVDTLPTADREALKTGITVDSPQKLLALIRDYTD